MRSRPPRRGANRAVARPRRARATAARESAGRAWQAARERQRELSIAQLRGHDRAARPRHRRREL